MEKTTNFSKEDIWEMNDGWCDSFFCKHGMIEPCSTGTLGKLADIIHIIFPIVGDTEIERVFWCVHAICYVGCIRGNSDKQGEDDSDDPCFTDFVHTWVL